MAKYNAEAERNLPAEREARQGTDPNDRPQRPFILDGDYPPRDQQAELYPGIQEDAFQAEQQTRLDALEREGGDLGGQWPGYPDRGQPESPEQYDQRVAHQEYLRACHGGLPDAPGEASAPVPFKNLKG